MSSKKVIDFLKNHKFIFVVRANHFKEADWVAKAAIRGGASILSFAQTIPHVEKLIARYDKKNILVGMSSVFELKDLPLASKSGACFITSPINKIELVKRCKQLGLVSFIGALTPTEIIRAQKARADFIKIFPVLDQGGECYVEDLKSVFGHLNLLVSGGVNPSNCARYLDVGAEMVSMSRGVASKYLVKAGEWRKIEENTKKVIRKIQIWRKRNGFKPLSGKIWR